MPSLNRRALLNAAAATAAIPPGVDAKAAQGVGSTWDVLQLVATTPANEAWRRLPEGGCPLVKV